MHEFQRACVGRECVLNREGDLMPALTSKEKRKKRKEKRKKRKQKRRETRTLLMETKHRVFQEKTSKE